MADPARVFLSGVTAQAGAVAPRDVTLGVDAGEIVALLGAARAGKTILLDLLAGFRRPRAGRVLVDGADATRTATRRRGIALVPHGLGLFAGLSVAATLDFVRQGSGLAPGLLDAAGLAESHALRPAALRAGERACLAVLRALAAAPRAVLLDEPASGLDGTEIDTLFTLLRRARQHGAAILYATRDAGQAMAIGDRMAVLAGGTIRQTGVPQAVYDAPADAAVAALTGMVNLLPGAVLERDGDELRVRLDAGTEMEAVAGEADLAALDPGARCLVGIRPERLAVSALTPAEFGDGSVPALVESLTQLGAFGRIGLRVGETPVTVLRPAGGVPPGLAAGRTVSVAWQAHHARAYRANAADGGTQAVAAAVPPR